MSLSFKPALSIPLLFGLLAVVACGASDKNDGREPDTGERAQPEGAFPGECDDGADNDFDGDFDCNDADCGGSPDCIENFADGDCSDGADNDRDGLFDCDDPDCADDAACATEDDCTDGADNDLDGLFDCDDPDCAENAACIEYEGDDAGECADGIDNDSDGLTDCDDPDCEGSPDCESTVVDQDQDGVPAEEDCDDSDPNSTILAEDADCDDVLKSEDCDDTDTSIVSWDNATESSATTTTTKQWTYSYAVTPTMSGSDQNYNNGFGALNDGVESYYGDSLSVGSWETLWAWWSGYVSPSIVVDLPISSLEVTEVGVYVSHGIGGGISAPSTATIFHRQNSSAAWVNVGSATLIKSIGWAAVPVVLPNPGGNLRVDLTAADEHTIISEISVQGNCVEP